MVRLIRWMCKKMLGVWSALSCKGDEFEIGYPEQERAKEALSVHLSGESVELINEKDPDEILFALWTLIATLEKELPGVYQAQIAEIQSAVPIASLETFGEIQEHVNFNLLLQTLRELQSALSLLSIGDSERAQSSVESRGMVSELINDFEVIRSFDAEREGIEEVFSVSFYGPRVEVKKIISFFREMTKDLMENEVEEMVREFQEESSDHVFSIFDGALHIFSSENREAITRYVHIPLDRLETRIKTAGLTIVSKQEFEKMFLN